jgi:acetyltransferase
VAVISNSGGIMNEVMSAGAPRGIGFSHLVNSGNEAGVTAADLLDYFVADPATDVVLAVLEAVRDPLLFTAACDRAAAARKPIVVLKMGRSEKGAHSVSTHTGALAGTDAVYSALFRQKGIIQVNDLDELVDMGALFSTAIPVLRNHSLERTGIIEISGGGKELLCDTCAAAGVELPELSAAGAATLQAVLPSGLFATNPVDTGGGWSDADKKDVYPVALEVLASEPDIDVVVSRYTIPRAGDLGALNARVDEMEAARAAHPDRLFVVLSRTTDQWSPEWEANLRDRHIAFLQGYGRGPRALAHLAAYSRFVHGSDAQREARPESPASPPRESQRLLDEIESKALLAAAGIPVVETVLATTAEQAVREAERMGYPVALKVLAPEIVHKSAQGGVRLGLSGAETVEQAFHELEETAAGARASFRGVTVQPMATPGAEVVLGAQRDPQFGPVIMCGLGGVFVEALNDVALRLAPLRPEDANAMLDELRGRRLLEGTDRPGISEALCRLSDLMLGRPDIVSVDVNPVFVHSAGLIAVDARVQVGS